MKHLFPILIMLFAVEALCSQVPAFPGAEGGVCMLPAVEAERYIMSTHSKTTTTVPLLLEKAHSDGVSVVQVRELFFSKSVEQSCSKVRLI